MLKINVITLHRARNYGSVLQALATQWFFEEFNVQAEFLDYFPERYTSFGLLKRLKHKNQRLFRHPILLFAARLLILPSYLKKRIVFNTFLRKYLKLTSKTFYSMQELQQNCPLADAYCTGSDQIWNSHWNEGIDSALYLNFLPASAYRFSFASSFGNIEISAEEQTAIHPMLQTYSHLSTREYSGQKILENMAFSNVTSLVDPTLLYTAQQWNYIASGKKHKQRYILTYNLHHDKTIDQYAQKLSKEQNLPVWNISYNLHDIHRPGKLIWCPPVEQFLSLIRDAAYVITDSFHGTVFSLIYEISFIVIFPDKSSDRLRHLLAMTNTQNRGFKGMPNSNIILRSLNTMYIHEVFKSQRALSESYIKHVFDDIRSENKTSASELENSSQHCTGCRSCEQSCTHQSITMHENAEGFLYPSIEHALCKQCKSCLKYCPNITPPHRNMPLEAFALRHKNSGLLHHSASGGAALAAAQSILRKGGIVFGAAYDENFVVRHIAISQKSELFKLQSSKYVQSDIGNCYTKVQTFLQQGKSILFTGTPCQIAGLYAFLGCRPHNLYTVDLICHGVPSPKLFSSYFIYLENQLKQQITSYNFRSKDARGWATQCQYKTSSHYISHPLSIDPYGIHFLSSDCLRESCYICPYANIFRISDLTVGDFWNIHRSYPHFYSEEGVSSVFVNTETGQILFHDMCTICDILPVSLQDAVKKQDNLLYPSKRPAERDTIYARLQENTFFQQTSPKLYAKIKSHLPAKSIHWLKRRKF